MRTELRINGANCANCLNATLNALREIPRVHSAETSSADGCLTIDHDDLDPVALLDVVRRHLHGTEISGTEIVMVSVEPLVAELKCHHSHSGGA